MSTEYNIQNLFLEAFGLKVSDGYKIPLENQKDDNKGLYNNIRIIEDENEYKEFSSYGTPILESIRFEGGIYRVNGWEKGNKKQRKFNDFRLPISSIISLSREKLMSITPINGGQGSVKEIYGFDDWQIKINGFIIPDDSQPQNLKTVQQQEAELLQWDEIAESIGVINENLLSKDVKYLTIKSISIEPIRGRPNIRQFSIDAESDTPLFMCINSEVK